MVKVIVCLKLVFDPEIPLSLFKVDSEALKPIPPQGMPPVFNPFDENALEAALKIKDHQDCHITVISLGEALPGPILKRVLALGADAVIALEDPEFRDLDPFTTARVLANAIAKIGDYDLVFTGRQAADWDAGLVWAGIAESLDLPSITLAKGIRIKDGKAVVERAVAEGIEVLETVLPALISFSNEAGKLRHVSLADLIKVGKKEISKWSEPYTEINALNPMEMRDLFIPDLGLVDCQFIDGETPEEKGRRLAAKLVNEMGLWNDSRRRI
jgi:electron transfer flavoprotein beta subunit